MGKRTLRRESRGGKRQDVAELVQTDLNTKRLTTLLSFGRGNGGKGSLVQREKGGKSWDSKKRDSPTRFDRLTSFLRKPPGREEMSEKPTF